MPKINPYPFQKCETKKKIDRTKELNLPYTRIPQDVNFSPAFRNLSANAIRIYIDMKTRFYKALDGHCDFKYARSFGLICLGLSKGSENSVKRAIKDLITNGFIEPTYITKGGKNEKGENDINRYKFSENWKNIK